MAKTKVNHRNKKKVARVYEELDLKQFRDIIKPKEVGNKHKKNNNKNHYKGDSKKPYIKDKTGKNTKVEHNSYKNNRKG